MSSFKKDLASEESRLENVSSDVVKFALDNGADECEVNIGAVKGLSVSCRDQDIENIEFNHDCSIIYTIFFEKSLDSSDFQSSE